MSRVGVLMPVYNCKNYIVRALDSILNQTFTDFRVYIIDDCSTDGTYEILQTYSDNRIVLHRNSQNKGLVYSLNYGVSLISEEYLARMDGDDFSMPNRFEKQISYMDENMEVALCGTQALPVEIEIASGTIKYLNKWNYPTNYEQLKVEFIFGSGFWHPSVFIRTSALREFSTDEIYSSNYKVSCEDWDLWFRIANHFPVVNLPDALIEYTFHPNNLHRSDLIQRQKDEYAIKYKVLKKMGITYLDIDMMDYYGYVKNGNLNSYFLILSLFNKIYKNNKTLKHFDELALKKSLINHALNLFLKSKKAFRSSFSFFSMPFFDFRLLSIKQYLKIFVKCISLS